MKQLFSKIMPRTIAGQMIAILALSFFVLLSVFAIEEILESQEDAMDWAESGRTMYQISTVKPILDVLPADQLENFYKFTSSCHRGLSVTDRPFAEYGQTDETKRLALNIAERLNLEPVDVLVGHATIYPEDFSFGRCRHIDDKLPAEGIIISVRLITGKWFHLEIHHHWHFWYIMEWVGRTSAIFIFIGVVAVFFIRRLTRPLDQLTVAAGQFGRGLKVSKLDEKGPPDLKRALQAFNAMQQQVADEVQKRTDTLASISHDVRTPLTALRIKAELIEDDEARQDLIASIEKMEKITASALEFLRGESRGEPKRETDISALLESECHDFEEMGHKVTFSGKANIHAHCRPEALARAIRNLIENAVKYAGTADVNVEETAAGISIHITDTGPGIPTDKIDQALAPFERLSKARESEQGGFGLGLSVAKAIAEGHDGKLILAANEPQGLSATISLPTTGD